MNMDRSPRVKRQREGGRLKLQTCETDEMNEEDLDRLLRGADIPDEVLKDMSIEEKKSNCSAILKTTAMIKNQKLDNTETDDRVEKNITADIKDDSKSNSKKAGRKSRTKLSLHSKKECQEKMDKDLCIDSSDPKSPDGSENDIPNPNTTSHADETQPPLRMAKKGKRKSTRIMTKLNQEQGKECDDSLRQQIKQDTNTILVPNTERFPATQDPCSDSSEQVVPESDSSSCQHPVDITTGSASTGFGKMWPPRFAPDLIKDPSVYTQVIKLMFDIYIQRLRRTKSRKKGKEEWGQPVSSGLHLNNSLRKDPQEDENKIDAVEGSRSKRYLTRSLHRNTVNLDADGETQFRLNEKEDGAVNIELKRCKQVGASLHTQPYLSIDVDGEMEPPVSASFMTGLEVMEYDTPNDVSTDEGDPDFNPFSDCSKKGKNTLKNKSQKNYSKSGKKKTEYSANEKISAKRSVLHGDDQEADSQFLTSEVPLKILKTTDTTAGITNKTEKREGVRFDTSNQGKDSDRWLSSAPASKFSMSPIVNTETKSGTREEIEDNKRRNRPSTRKKGMAHIGQDSQSHDDRMTVTISHMNTALVKSDDGPLHDLSEHEEDPSFELDVRDHEKDKKIVKRKVQRKDFSRSGKRKKGTSDQVSCNATSPVYHDDNAITTESNLVSIKSSARKLQGRGNLFMQRNLGIPEKHEGTNSSHLKDTLQFHADNAGWLSTGIISEPERDDRNNNLMADSRKKRVCTPSGDRPDFDIVLEGITSSNVLIHHDEASKDSVSDSSTKSSQTSKTSSLESMPGRKSKSKEVLSDSSVKVISSLEDTIDPDDVKETIPNSQSSGFLLDSNGDMYCTQIDTDKRKHLSDTSDSVTLRPAYLKARQSLEKKRKTSRVPENSVVENENQFKKHKMLQKKRQKQAKLEFQVEHKISTRNPSQVIISDDEDQPQDCVEDLDKKSRSPHSKSAESQLQQSAISTNSKIIPQQLKGRQKPNESIGTENQTQSTMKKNETKRKSVNKRKEKDITTERPMEEQGIPENISNQAVFDIKDSTDSDNEIQTSEINGICPICGKEFPNKDLELHASSCSDFLIEPEIRTQCMVCKEHFPVNKLKRHQASCAESHSLPETRKRGKAKADFASESGCARKRSKRKQRAPLNEESPLSSGDDFGELHIEVEKKK